MKSFKTIALAALVLTGCAVGVAAPASAQDAPLHRYGVSRHAVTHHAGMPLTVRRHTLTVRRAPSEDVGSPVYNPYAGNGAFGGLGTVVTGPTAIASNIVGGVFDVGNRIFPADPRSPLVIVGAPIRLAGMIAQVPFRIVEAPFRAAAGYPAF